MPFKPTYFVKFAHGNLTPNLKPKGWPGMTLSAPTQSDPYGLRFKITRLPSDPPQRQSVYVVPPYDLPIETRLLLRVTFDLPYAEGFSDHGPFSGETELPGSLALVDPSSPTVPEPWAVALSVSTENHLASARNASTTCQFHHLHGLRLNTTGLQVDQAAGLEGPPIDYDKYLGVDDADGAHKPPTIFILEHSFCGQGAATIGHTAGTGFLKISRGGSSLNDHRVYSSTTLTNPSAGPIRALGISLSTLVGVGQMSVRLRSFGVWFNPRVYPGPRPEEWSGPSGTATDET